MRLRPLTFLAAALATMALSACTAFNDPDLAALADEPLSSEPAVRTLQPYTFGTHAGLQIQTAHFNIHTTISDPLYTHMIVRTLEAAHLRNTQLAGFRPSAPMDCYIFASRSQWSDFTRQHAGESAAIYLRIESGGYSQSGVFAGYDITRDQTLSVIAHESWHQYAYFAFKDRLPSWLDEGLATQNEAIEWQSAQPVFVPEQNYPRLSALRRSLHNGALWKLPDLLSTHAGLVIKMPQSAIDAYYAQLWSFALFLEESPVYAPRLKTLLADASAGKLTAVLAGTSVTADEIAGYSERWNHVAGPLYLQHYLNPDMDAIEREYLAWASQFAGH